MSRFLYTYLDGDGRPPRCSSKTLIIFVILCFICLSVYSLLQKRKTVNVDKIEEVFAKASLPPREFSKPGSVFEAFYSCVRPKLTPMEGSYDEFWFGFVNLTKQCNDLQAYKAIDLREAKNRDEVKYVAYPKHADNLTMVTFGIGHDVSAEINLKEMHEKTEFYGVDPSPYINQNLYEKHLGGKYFEYAISGHGGMKNSKVFGKGGYREEVTKHIGADDFLKNKVQKNRIDMLWIDVEGHEYPILDQLHHNGVLDKKGIKVCQMNVEMHRDTFKESLGEMKKFYDFVWKVLEDKRYIILKPVFIRYMKKRFIRIFIVNVFDKECTDLYLS